VGTQANQRLFAARDRFGIKPLYYAVYDNTLYLASENQALFAAGVLARWDHEYFYQHATGPAMSDRLRRFRWQPFSFCDFIDPVHQKLATAARWGWWNAYSSLALLPCPGELRHSRQIRSFIGNSCSSKPAIRNFRQIP
jgi:hypothetical protein